MVHLIHSFIHRSIYKIPLYMLYLMVSYIIFKVHLVHSDKYKSIYKIPFYITHMKDICV